MTTAVAVRGLEAGTADNLASLDFDELFRPFRTEGVEERRVTLLARRPGVASVKVSRWVYAPDLDEDQTDSLLGVIRLYFGLDLSWKVSMTVSHRQPREEQFLV